MSKKLEEELNIISSKMNSKEVCKTETCFERI